MKIKNNQKSKKETWQLGDVIADTLSQEFALIVEDNEERFVAMDISNTPDGGYRTEASMVWGNPHNTIKELQKSLYDWCKVDATLIINGDFKQDED